MTRRGFTLHELLMVVIILMILTSVAMVGYGRTVEISYWNAANQMVQTIYAGQKVYFSLNDAYRDCVGAPATCNVASWRAIYMDSPNQAGGQITFNWTRPTLTTFTATATRNLPNRCGAAVTRTITQAGALGGTWTGPC